MTSNPIMDRITPGYQEVDITKTGSYIANNGVLSYLSLDIDQPGKYWFNLSNVFNGTVGEMNKTLPVMFTRGGQPIPLNSYTVKINGLFPDGETEFHVTGAQLQSSDAIVNFNFPIGLFSNTGSYQFQFEIDDNNGSVMTSHWCVIQVTQNANVLGYSWTQGVNPYDSDYQAWKTKLDNQMKSAENNISTLETTADVIKNSVQAYSDNVNNIVDQALSNVPKLNADNNYSGSNTFGQVKSGSLNSDNVTAGQLTANNGASLPASTKLNASIIANNNYDLEQGLFPNTGYFVVNMDDQSQNIGGVHGFNLGNHGYISIKKFLYTPRSGDVENAIIEIHANTTITDGAVGQIIMTFQPHQLDGVDQTPFYFGGCVVQFDSSANGLRVVSKQNSKTDNSFMDAAFI